MSIVTQTMLVNRIGEAVLIRLTDDEVTGSVDGDVMNRAIDEGEGELLNNVAQRYVIPLTLGNAHTASAVKAMMLDAVVYRLFMHRDHAVSEEHTGAYKHAVDWSIKIAEGKLGLTDETLLGESPGQKGKMIIDGSPRVISRESTKGL